MAKLLTTRNADFKALKPALWFVFCSIAALLVARGWLTEAVPLTDTTEARYGEIARLMSETGNWVTPQHAYGVPFLAKPPLAFWLSAAAVKLLGPTTLAPRLPILAATILFLAFVFHWVRQQLGTLSATAYVAALGSTAAFFIASAAVMTDMILTICVSVSLLMFWSAYSDGKRSSAWLMFVFIGLGLLTKGPFAAFLVLMPILVWSIVQRRVLSVWREIPWIRGGFLTLAVALPWYIIAEYRTPGFLEYFIVGENLSRLVQSEWQGDLYGRVHDQPLGTIWLYFIGGIFPSGLALLPLILLRKRQLPQVWATRGPFISFMLIWALTPLLLFTFAPNIIFPYALPATPPALLAMIAASVTPDGQDRNLLRLCGISAWVLIVPTMLVAARLLGDSIWMGDHSQQPVLQAIAQQEAVRGYQMYYWDRRVYSGQYYSQGKAGFIADADELRERMSAAPPICLIAKDRRFLNLDESLRGQFSNVLEHGDYVVLCQNS